MAGPRHRGRRRIIGSVHQVSNVIGPGFLEKVYENALGVELGLAGLRVTQQQRIELRYRESLVGEFVADRLVEGCVIVWVNFGSPKAVVKRIVHGC